MRDRPRPRHADIARAKALAFQIPPKSERHHFRSMYRHDQHAGNAQAPRPGSPSLPPSPLRRTEDAYTHWTRRFVLHQGKRHPATLGATEVTAFLAHLADERHVSASTQNQALCALYCFCIAASSASPCPIDSNCRKLDERHTCWRWLRHSHGPGTARPRRRQHDDDLHPRAEPRRTRRPEPGR